jgi:hypothetical protein
MHHAGSVRARYNVFAFIGRAFRSVWIRLFAADRPR